MFKAFKTWYHTRFSDPEIVALVTILLFGFAIVYFFGGLLAPFLVSIVIAYLLEWPVSHLVSMGMKRWLSTSIVILVFIGLMLMAFLGLIPTIWNQTMELIKDMPMMFNNFQFFVGELPNRYPDVIDPKLVDNIMGLLRDKILGMGESILKESLASLLNLVSLGIYMILVPLLAFFLLKDKDELLGSIMSLLPNNRRLANNVGLEMNHKITNYIRGKFTEVVIVAVVTYIGLAAFGLRYSLLLSVSVGLSVLIPYVGAAVVTIPVAMVAVFQFGLSPTMGWIILTYLIIQALDGNLLVPLIFSEAVNLHPVWIIVSVLFFGGIWGFWGVFFAIPLATLVKTVWSAFTTQKILDAK